MGLIPGSGRSLGSGNGNPLQYSCLGNPTDRGAWQATIHWVAELVTTQQLNNKEKLTTKRINLGMSLVIQWLRLCASNAGGLGLIPGQEKKRSHMSGGETKRWKIKKERKNKGIHQ